jgi:hypothetical protein
MLDSKFLFTLIGLLVTVFALCKTDVSRSINEGFWMNSVPRQAIRMREVHGTNPDGSKNSYSLQNNFQSALGNSKFPFVQYPSYQAQLSPRFSNVQYGANISYNMPSYEHQAAPCEPLTFGDMAQENYQENYCSGDSCGGSCGGGCSVTSCGSGDNVKLGKPMPGSDPNYIKAMSDLYNESEYPEITDIVPVGDMQSVGADGQLQQSIVYDRYIYANAKSFTYGQGDPIRGDLAITPCNYGWFNPSANPATDLREGAMNVIGGDYNETANELAELKYAATGGYDTVNHGQPLSHNMVNQFSSQLGGGIHNDLQVTAFP